MFPLPLKLILSLTALSLLLVAAAFVQSGRAEPALTRSNSVLPPPNTCSMQTSPKPPRAPSPGTAPTGKPPPPLPTPTMPGSR